jgi:hypothetical protein
VNSLGSRESGVFNSIITLYSRNSTK